MVVLQSTLNDRSEEVAQFLKRFPMDIELPHFTYGPGFEGGTRAVEGTYYDEWGCPFEVRQAGLKGEVKQAPLIDWADLDSINPPFGFLESADFSQVDPQCQASDKFVLAKTKARPFERIQFLRGTENVMIDLASNSSDLDMLISMVHEFNMREMEMWSKTAVDAIFFQDDWGSQTGMLISPQMWRERFKPIYQDYCEMIKGCGKYVFYHSDGNIMAIIPDLIEMGVDALNSQLFCMDIEEIGVQFRGQITFWGEIDRQHVLPFGDVHEVHLAVSRVRTALESKNRGVIAWCEWGDDVPHKNIEAVYQAWEESR
jgi:hypothetical protein